MEVTLVCDCDRCFSTLIKLGSLNILCDVPSRLLADFSESLKKPLLCDPSASCGLYEKLQCSKIHVILVTSASGLEGLDKLCCFYDLTSTHIVCTRPVYVLSTIYYRNRAEGNGGYRQPSKGFRNNILIDNLKEVTYRTELTLKNFANKSLLHLVSYNEPVELTLTSSLSYPNFDTGKEISLKDGKNVRADVKGGEFKAWNEKLDHFSCKLRVVAMSNGHTLGSCNYIIQHENLSNRVIFVSKSSNFKRYTRPFDYSIFDDVTEDDVVVLYSRVFSQATKSLKLKQDRGLKVEDEKLSMYLDVGRNKGDKMDSELLSGKRLLKRELPDTTTSSANTTFATGSLTGNISTGKPIGRDYEVRDQDDNLFEVELKDEIDRYTRYCIEQAIQGRNVFVPLDLNYEYFIDLLANLCANLKLVKKQVYTYCVGQGVEEFFEYIDKCCEWVREERSELTMHSHDPKSPFFELEEMRMNNLLFYSNTLQGISNVYKAPSILFLLSNDGKRLRNYIMDGNNRFLILQSRFLSCFNSLNGTSNGTGGSELLGIKPVPGMMNQGANYLFGHIDLTMVLSNINVPCTRVNVNQLKETWSREMNEDGVGLVTVKGDLGGLKFKNVQGQFGLNVFNLEYNSTSDVKVKQLLSDRRGESVNLDDLISFGKVDCNGLVNALKRDKREVKVSKLGDCVELRGNDFTILLKDGETIIESNSDVDRRNILKIIQDELVSM